MKKLIIILTVVIISLNVNAQNFTDSFYTSAQWYYTMQPKTGYVKYFYPKEKYTPYIISKIYKLYPELLDKPKQTDTLRFYNAVYYPTDTALAYDSSMLSSTVIHWSSPSQKDYQHTTTVGTYTSSTPILHTFKIMYSYTLIGKNKSGTKTITSYHYPTFQDVLNKAKIPKQVAIGDVYISMYEQ